MTVTYVVWATQPLLQCILWGHWLRHWHRHPHRRNFHCRNIWRICKSWGAASQHNSHKIQHDGLCRVPSFYKRATSGLGLLLLQGGGRHCKPAEWSTPCRDWVKYVVWSHNRISMLSQLSLSTYENLGIETATLNWQYPPSSSWLLEDWRSSPARSQCLHFLLLRSSELARPPGRSPQLYLCPSSSAPPLISTTSSTCSEVSSLNTGNHIEP